jgi:hypothetical protein
MATPAAPAPKPASRSAGDIVLIVVGAILAIISIVPLVGGAALVVIHATQRDDGFYSSRAETLATPTAALVSDGLDVGTDGPDWLFEEGRLGTIRLTATGTSTRPVFIGIAREADVDDYLRGVAHDLVADFDVDPFSVTYERRPGTADARPPGTQGFWAVSSSGVGERTVTWPVEEGTWTAVAMNADGSPGIRTDVSVAAKVGYLLWVGVGLLVLGGLIAALGAILIVLGVRRPRAPPAPPSPEAAAPVSP